LFTDFSDAIGKPSTLASRTKLEIVRKSGQDATEEGEPLETPLQRYERLRAEITTFLRDIENIKSARSHSKSSGDANSVEEDVFEGVSLVELADRLKSWQTQLQAVSKAESGFDTLTTGGGGKRMTMQTDLTSQLLGKISALKIGGLEGASGASTLSSASSAVAGEAGVATYELVYSKDMAKESKLVHLAELERRLATLEMVVTGRVAPELTELPSVGGGIAGGTGKTKGTGLIHTVDDVRSKVTSLDDRAIDQLSHRMIKLTQQLEALRAAKQASNVASTSADGTSSSGLKLDPEQEKKIDSVYHSLSQVETVAAELPIVVERMVQLRSLHEQAVHFSSQLSTISSSQTELSSVLRSNLSGINRMQESLTNNMATIEKNVLALEKRIADVSTLLAK
jgi:dynactin-2